ncbi:uncharacterized protein LOC123297764 isoform X3 [Chrysoperla carnea]|uniref:uncharacterized protein LOC123297764 isoform X3 n=1 Tax=Chrysoperla carnea TaxID=189513 RepID=UPI001D07ECCC|nr:uncharacterized protein LOC123297764 isoform X3 [Chrysoperla carnea]
MPSEIENNTKTINMSPDQTGGSENNKKATGWVKFEEDGQVESSSTAAVINTESVQVNLDGRSVNQAKSPAKKNDIAVDTGPSTLRTIELGNNEVVRQGFINGDVVVTLLPVNTRWPWITPAQFRPELVPEELMAQGLTLTVEEYVQAMELLVNDVRFTMYNICYKRVLVVWIVLAFSVLLGLLFSGLTGLIMFSLGVAWLVLNASAIFLCMWVKIVLSKGLERCLAHVNKQLLRHKLIIALDDRGKISCHKVNLCFLYLDPGPCIAHLQSIVEQQEREPNNGGWEQRMDISASDIVIQGAQTTRLSRKQGRAEQLFLRYLQRWGKDYLRRRLDWTLDEADGNPPAPRHLSRALCPCQYAEGILLSKPKSDTRAFCACWSDFLKTRGID